MKQLLRNPRARIAVLAVLVVGGAYFLMRGRTPADPTAGLPVAPDTSGLGPGLDTSGLAGGAATTVSDPYAPLPDAGLNEAVNAAINSINDTYNKMIDALNQGVSDGSFGPDMTATDIGAGVTATTILTPQSAPPLHGPADVRFGVPAAPIGQRIRKKFNAGGASNGTRSLQASGDGSAAAPGNRAVAARASVPAIGARLRAALQGRQLQPAARPIKSRRRKLPKRGATPRVYYSPSGARVVTSAFSFDATRSALASLSRDFSPASAVVRSSGVFTPRVSSGGAPARLGGGGGGFVVQPRMPAPTVLTPALRPLGGGTRSTVLAL